MHIYLVGLEVSARKIDITRLKKFAFSEIPKDNPLREVLLSECDVLDSAEFLAKSDVWLKLASLAVPHVSKIRLSNNNAKVKQ